MAVADAPATTKSTRKKKDACAEKERPVVSKLWGFVHIPIIAGCGEPGTGKTLFGLTIDPENTLCYDLEGSSECYTGLGFTRVDVQEEVIKMLKELRPMYTEGNLEWFHNDVRQRATPGKYTVIMVDPITDLEPGIADHVEANAEKFGYTKNQFDKGGGLFWGAVKEFERQVVLDIKSRCETFYFTIHMRSQFAGNTPTGRREPKGKESLVQLASLYLKFERKPDTNGNVPDEPAAVKLLTREGQKDRIAITEIVDGKPRITPCLPPRLPVATPDTIREYIRHPADYNKLKAKERLEPDKLSDDEKLRLQAFIAEQEASTEQAKLTRIELMRAPLGTTADTPPPASTPQCLPEQIETIKSLMQQAFTEPGDFIHLLSQYGVSKAGELSVENASAVINRMTELAQERAGAAAGSVAAAEPAPFDNNEGALPSTGSNLISPVVAQVILSEAQDVIGEMETLKKMIVAHGAQTIKELTVDAGYAVLSEIRAKVFEKYGDRIRDAQRNRINEFLQRGFWTIGERDAFMASRKASNARALSYDDGREIISLCLSRELGLSPMPETAGGEPKN